MQENHFQMLVWVGRDVIERQPLFFASTLARELRHVEQFVREQQLHYAGVMALGYIVRRALSRGEGEYNAFDSPTEWDAEVLARAVVGGLYGEPAASNYYRERVARNRFFAAFVDPKPVYPLPEIVASLRTWVNSN